MCKSPEEGSSFVAQETSEIALTSKSPRFLAEDMSISQLCYKNNQELSGLNNGYLFSHNPGSQQCWQFASSVGSEGNTFCSYPGY
jgi:hypothetical protein